MRISILGDSFSAYDGILQSESPIYPQNDVTSPSKMWWGILASSIGAKIVDVVACGGSMIADDRPGRRNPSVVKKSFAHRLEDARLHDPGIIIIFGGVNDTTNKSPAGKVKNEISKCCKICKERYANAKVVVVVPAEDTTTWWSCSKPIKMALSSAAKENGAVVVDLDGCYSSKNWNPEYGSYGHLDAAGNNAVAQRIIGAIQKMDNLTENDNDYNIEMLDKPNEIKSYVPAVIDMIDKSYKKIGGFAGDKSTERFLNQTSLLQLVRNSSDSKQFIACAIYQKKHGGNKLRAIACDQSPEGKAALQKIIKLNINKLSYTVWAEVSEAIEHYYKKFNGHPILNCFAKELLELGDDEYLMLLDDKFHYEREIGPLKKRLVKVIFGFSDYNNMKKVMNDAGYQRLRQIFNGATVSEADQKYGEVVANARTYVNKIAEMAKKGEFDSFDPASYDTMIDAKNALANSVKKFPELKKTLTLCDKILKSIPKMKFGKLK